MKIFKNDGSVNETELKIVNFRPVGTNKNGEAEISNKQWEEVQYFQDNNYDSTLKCSKKRLRHDLPFSILTF